MKYYLKVSDIQPSDNQAYRVGNSRNRFALYLTDAGKIWKDYIAYQCEKKPTDKMVRLWITITFKDHRRRDIQNFQKLTIDSLQGLWYEDDSQIADLHLYKRIGKDISTEIKMEKI